jgi:trehalose 2-sulfotransferase
VSQWLEMKTARSQSLPPNTCGTPDQCAYGDGAKSAVELPIPPSRAWSVSKVPPVGPTRSYLICANARCGSTLLSRALSDTGIAGHPDEYFVTGPPEAFAPGSTFWEEGSLARQHGITERDTFLQLVYRVGTTPNGVFGATLMWNYVEWAMDNFREMPLYSQASTEELFASLFPGLQVIHVVRQDRLRQAISWLRAAEDRVWVVSEDEPARPQREPVFQYDVVVGMMDLIAQGEAAWMDLYQRLGIEPAIVVYEEFSDPSGYEPTIRHVLEHLGLDHTVGIPRPRTMKQADHISDEWVDRFLRRQSTRETTR